MVTRSRATTACLSLLVQATCSKDGIWWCYGGEGSGGDGDCDDDYISYWYIEHQVLVIGVKHLLPRVSCRVIAQHLDFKNVAILLQFWLEFCFNITEYNVKIKVTLVPPTKNMSPVDRVADFIRIGDETSLSQKRSGNGAQQKWKKSSCWFGTKIVGTRVNMQLHYLMWEGCSVGPHGGT